MPIKEYSENCHVADKDHFKYAVVKMWNLNTGEEVMISLYDDEEKARKAMEREHLPFRDGFVKLIKVGSQGSIVEHLWIHGVVVEELVKKETYDKQRTRNWAITSGSLTEEEAYKLFPV